MSKAICELCGEPMPAGEEMFKFHGYSGGCPKPPLPRPKQEFKYGNAAGLEAKLLPGEPWFALRAKDMYSIRGVEAYMTLCAEMGLVDHVAGVKKALDQMRDWQAANPDKVKTPD